MSYEADVTREGSQWLATVRGLEGAHTYAGNLTALRDNILEVIALVTDAPDDADAPPLRLVFSDEADALVAQAVGAGEEREAAEKALAVSRAVSEQLVAQMTAAGYSVRDIAGALRLSPGRVSQIMAPAAARTGSTSTSTRASSTGRVTTAKNVRTAARVLKSGYVRSPRAARTARETPPE